MGAVGAIIIFGAQTSVASVIGAVLDGIFDVAIFIISVLWSLVQQLS